VRVVGWDERGEVPNGCDIPQPPKCNPFARSTLIRRVADNNFGKFALCTCVIYVNSGNGLRLGRRRYTIEAHSCVYKTRLSIVLPVWGSGDPGDSFISSECSRPGEAQLWAPR
jgi:hypothetical protein